MRTHKHNFGCFLIIVLTIVPIVGQAHKFASDRRTPHQQDLATVQCGTRANESDVVVIWRGKKFELPAWMVYPASAATRA